ncbi:hypothetical protein OnM2_087052 [Erysiphe neolycopersici]|uniref:Uncharacterized protein n=1 Tax=Erysiphe neolycopersici TaxID=212602 RepID=A0A420HEA4_9PEZI|nr:hypothetical protein OnM2_087052 [Erysiphe neolycopersici]
MNSREQAIRGAISVLEGGVFNSQRKAALAPGLLFASFAKPNIWSTQYV